MAAMTDTPTTAAALGRAFAEGRADPRDVVEDVLARIAAADPAIFITVTAERARAEAAASAARYAAGRPLGPLDGVPVAWKDLVDLAGTTTTAASDVYRNAPPAAADAPIAANLAAAGMVSVGKTNLSEFAYSGIGLNPHFGTPANPRDPAVPRAPGGSSSGSAVAVAAGLVPVAIGSDTGGSIRIPAAFCGLVGFKTSEGRVDKAGVFPLSPTLDTIGPLATTVEDCALVERALRGLVPEAPAPAPLAGLRIVVPRNLVFDEIEPAVAAAFEGAVAALADAGVAIERRAVPELDEVARLARDHGTITAAEAYRFHRALVDGPDASRVDQRVTARILAGKRMSALDLLELQDARRRLIPALAERLGGALLAMPSVVHVAPEIAPLEADVNLFHQTNLRTLRNTALGNMLNLTGLSLPVGHDPAGLPIGFLLSAPGGEEDRLLAVGLAVEAIFRARGD
jgi:aspartyl-tRNA(Asn)/glutamyl-tRNA(Gln) amidotransferase subunit A